MRRIIAAILGSSVVLCAAGDPVVTDRVRTSLAGTWKELTVTAVVNDSCMGSIHHGFRIVRTEYTTSIASIETSRGELRVGRSAPLEQTRLESLITESVHHFEAAASTVGTQEALNQRLAKLTSVDERLKEIVRASHEDSGSSIAICITIGDGLTAQRFDDEFDRLKAPSFTEFITTNRH
jgi:hypothetical protein